MRKYINSAFILLTLFFGQTSFAQAMTNSNTNQLVNQEITQWISQHQIPGVAVAIYYKGQDHYYNFGVADSSTNKPVTKDTIFELGSVTKSFTATLLGICVEQRKCKLSDPVSLYLPALANNNNDAISHITLQELATHTSSLPRMAQDLGVSQVTAANANNQLMLLLPQWQPNNPIGTHYLYSNIGYGLLGEAVANALGSNYNDAVNQYIFNPLNMSSSYVTVPDSQQYRYAQGYNEQGNPAPHYVNSPWPGGGGLRSSAYDMLQYLKANLGVSSTPTQLFAAMKLTQQGYFQVKPNFTQGLAWQLMHIHNLDIINKNGMNKGFNTYVAIVPQQQIAIVVLANKRGVIPGKIANQILQDLSQS